MLSDRVDQLLRIFTDRADTFSDHPELAEAAGDDVCGEGWPREVVATIYACRRIEALEDLADKLLTAAKLPEGDPLAEEAHSYGVVGVSDA